MELQIKNVSKAFKEKQVVDQFSLDMAKGECVGLIGPNGSGKSTLIKIIANIFDADEGEVLFNQTVNRFMKKEIGYLPQFPHFYSWMTAKETLLFMGQLSGVTQSELNKSIPIMLEKVGLIKEANTKIETFSGGMKQRLGIAQTLLHKPTLILLDEPVSALDPIGRREIINLIQKINQDTTILLSTHILADVEEVCSRFVMIKNGIKIEDNTRDELFNQSDENKIHIEAMSLPTKWINQLKELAYIKDMNVDGSHLMLEINDIKTNKHHILRSALDNEIDVIKFEIYHYSLEARFIDWMVDI